MKHLNAPRTHERVFTVQKVPGHQAGLIQKEYPCGSRGWDKPPEVHPFLPYSPVRIDDSDICRK